MRSALGGAHEKGGKHISGAERIVTQDGLELTVIKMLQRAKTHQRGSADFINIKVELIETDKIIYQPLLAINSYETNNYNDGRKIALEQLIIDGVSHIAAQKGIECIKSLNDSMRGAILLDAITGERLDNNISRGIRVSNMDAENNALYILELSKSGYVGEHVQIAIIYLFPSEFLLALTNIFLLLSFPVQNDDLHKTPHTLEYFFLE